MAGINKVIILGRLGQDPEVRYTPSGQAVANFSVATSDVWLDKQSGEKQERTEWHKIVVWGKLAELCRDYLKKGKQVYIEGKLQTRSWVDKNDQKKYMTETIGQNIQFIDMSSRNENTRNETNSNATSNNRTNNSNNTDDGNTNKFENIQTNSDNFISDEDIPF